MSWILPFLLGVLASWAGKHFLRGFLRGWRANQHRRDARMSRLDLTCRAFPDKRHFPNEHHRN